MKGSREIKVGLFVLMGLAFSALVIFLIGDERRLFASSVEFTATFQDVQGLKNGAPVRMGGIDIGHVDDVSYGKEPGDTTIYVVLSIVKHEAGRIKTDSVAEVASKGLLGDKMVSISKGDAPTAIPPHGRIKSKEPDDMLGKVGGMAAKADSALDNVDKFTHALADERFQKDIQESVRSINLVLTQVAGGDGYPHKFLTDKAEANRISHALDSIDRSTQELTLTLAEVRSISERIKNGPGFAHEVIYGEGPKKQVEQFGNAADQVAQTLKGIRESDSFVHDALYGGKPGANNGAEALANVTAMTADMRTIVANVKAGKGTVGALLVDPSVYEDLKTVLGNVERNEVLRALVRYSIKQDEKKPSVEIGATTGKP